MGYFSLLKTEQGGEWAECGVPQTPDGDWDWGNWAHYIEDRRSKLSTNVSFSERRLNLPSWGDQSVLNNLEPKASVGPLLLIKVVKSWRTFIE